MLVLDVAPCAGDFSVAIDRGGMVEDMLPVVPEKISLSSTRFVFMGVTVVLSLALVQDCPMGV